ncbi:MAG: hypothetical protein GY765_37895 [bacterium]|nr:hypothetical protein [bacterium]
MNKITLLLISQPNCITERIVCQHEVTDWHVFLIGSVFPLVVAGVSGYEFAGIFNMVGMGASHVQWDIGDRVHERAFGYLHFNHMFILRKSKKYVNMKRQ